MSSRANGPQTRAAIFLESLQARFYRASGLPEPDGGELDESTRRQILAAASGVRPDGPEMEALLREMSTAEERRRAAVPTRFENPGYYDLLLRMAGQIEDVFRALGRDVPTRPLLGTLRSGRVNAMAVAVPDSDDFIVLFEDGLFGFANLLSKAVAAVIPSASTADGRWRFSVAEAEWFEQLERNPEPRLHLLDALTAYLLRGHPHAARPYLLDTPQMTLAGVLRDSMELFVLGHEYGHIVSGHLSKANLKRSRVGVDQADVIALNYSQEFEADGKGLEFMLNAMLAKGFDLSLSFWGADFFFACVDIIEQTVSLILYGEKRDVIVDTHPPTQLRREVVREILRRSAPQDAAAAIGLADILASILRRMFGDIESTLIELHRKGSRLAPGWAN